jgi:hypothetical protein
MFALQVPTTEEFSLLVLWSWTECVQHYYQRCLFSSLPKGEPGCSSQLSITVTNQLERRKGSFLPHRFNDFSAWFHCFWACGEVEHHLRCHVEEQSLSPYGGQ